MADTKTKKSIYETLSTIDVSKYLDNIKIKSKKSGITFSLNYLSWAKAWGLVKAIYPNATYEIKEYPNWERDGNGTYQQCGTLDYRITSVGCEVEVSVKIEDQKFTQKLYPMDRYNNPIMKPTIKDINKAQLRCLVKALATAGLGLNVYAGEDLPANSDETSKKPTKAKKSIDWSKPEKLTDDQLQTRTVIYNREPLKLTVLAKHVAKNNKDAIKFADDLVGTDALVFKEIAKRGLTA